MAAEKVWENEAGAMYHDSCFKDGESRDGYKQKKLEDLQDDDECASCGGIFLSGLEPIADDDDDDDDDLEEEMEEEEKGGESSP